MKKKTLLRKKSDNEKRVTTIIWPVVQEDRFDRDYYVSLNGYLGYYIFGMFQI